MIVKVTQFKTSDGQLFPTEDLAIGHEKTLPNPKLKLEVEDLLNQILIKLDKVSRAEVSSVDGYSRITNIVSSDSDLLFLASVKDYIMSVLNSESSAAEYTNNYYDSSCY